MVIWLRSPIWSVIIRVITKSDDRAAGTRFVYHEYHHRPNWTTRNLIIKYDEVISQLQVANNRISQQFTTIKNVQEELNKVKKQATDASHQAEELAQYIRRDCLEISGVPPSESYSSLKTNKSSIDIPRTCLHTYNTRYAASKISTKHESEQTLGNKLYPTWLQFFGIIFLLIWKILMSTNFLNKLNCTSFLTNLKLHDISDILIINFLRISTAHMVRSGSLCLYSSLYIL